MSAQQCSRTQDLRLTFNFRVLKPMNVILTFGFVCEGVYILIGFLLVFVVVGSVGGVFVVAFVVVVPLRVLGNVTVGIAWVGWRMVVDGNVEAF